VLNRLKRTTNTGGNKWRLSSMQNIIDNLGDYMRDIADTPLYNDKIDKLNKNIYTTTALFHIYMQDYIYDEVRELTQLQQDIGRRQVIILLVTLIAFIVLVALILSYSLRFARRITRPITQLVQKAEKIGSGDFSIEPIRTGAKELQLLDEGVNEMAERIHALLEKEVQDQKALHRAELELLRAQINPHFLYNTLDSIVWLAEAKKNDDVVKMVTSLSVFFRNSLGRGQDVITLREEQDQVRSYLEIQKIRYNDILVYDIDISEELLRFAIPKLTLQPLVENAIYHGTKHKRAVGQITIEGREAGETILLYVRDNGTGMSAERLEMLRDGVYGNKHLGLGLVNVHRRIQLYYGDEYGLSFDSIPGEGMTVTVKIPKSVRTEI
jgi:two-component system sensor histidine kinase YesM